MFKIILVPALMLGAAWAGTARAAEGGSNEQAIAFIEALGQRLLATQASTAADAAELRQGALEDLIRDGFNLDLTSQLVLGKYWSRASAGQRAAFKDLFAPYLLSTYARQLDAYRLETLAVVACKRVGERDFLVQTSIEGNSEVANAVWRLRARGGAYRIIDVLVDGISLALTERSQFASVIGREGFEGMLALLRERVSGRATEPEGGLGVALPASVLVSPNTGKIELLLRQQ
jgi:phospholipid transport system substrate-binding protein